MTIKKREWHQKEMKLRISSRPSKYKVFHRNFRVLRHPYVLCKYEKWVPRRKIKESTWVKFFSMISPSGWGGGVITVLNILWVLKNSKLNIDTKLHADFFVVRITNGTLHFCKKSKDKTFYFGKYEQNQYLVLKNSKLNIDTKLHADFVVVRSTNSTLHFCQKSKDKTFYFGKYGQNQYLTLCIIISWWRHRRL